MPTCHCRWQAPGKYDKKWPKRCISNASRTLEDSQPGRGQLSRWQQSGFIRVREHSGNIQWTFGEHSGNIQWTFREQRHERPPAHCQHFDAMLRLSKNSWNKTENGTETKLKTKLKQNWNKTENGTETTLKRFETNWANLKQTDTNWNKTETKLKQNWNRPTQTETNWRELNRWKLGRQHKHKECFSGWPKILNPKP
jgi:hypothetical protein